MTKPGLHSIVAKWKGNAIKMSVKVKRPVYSERSKKPRDIIQIYVAFYVKKKKATPTMGSLWGVGEMGDMKSE